MFGIIIIGIDLGIVNILVYSKEKGIILNEFFVVVLNMNDGMVFVIG